MSEKIHFIYKTTNLRNGRFYIGMHSTTNVNDGYLGSGDRLRNEIEKYGRDNFVREILEFAHDRESLKELEQKIVNESLLQNPSCLNLKCGGDGGATRGGVLGGKIGGKLNGRRNFQQAHLTMKELGTLFTLGMLGKSHSETTKLNMSKSQTGEGNSQFGTKWMNKDGLVVKVKVDEVQGYLLQGFSFGRK